MGLFDTDSGKDYYSCKNIRIGVIGSIGKPKGIGSSPVCGVNSGGMVVSLVRFQRRSTQHKTFLRFSWQSLYDNRESRTIGITAITSGFQSDNESSILSWCLCQSYANGKRQEASL